MNIVKQRAVCSMSWLVVHPKFFRLFVKGKFDAYVLWPLPKRVQNCRSTTHNFTVPVIVYFQFLKTCLKLRKSEFDWSLIFFLFSQSKKKDKTIIPKYLKIWNFVKLANHRMTYIPHKTTPNCPLDFLNI